MKKELGIVAYKCRQCGKLHFPFHDRCLICRGREFEKMKPEGKARLLTFTRIYNLPWGFDERYLTIGVVEFDNKIRAMGRIEVDESFQLGTGMMMDPEWGPVRKQYGENVYGLILKPSQN